MGATCRGGVARVRVGGSSCRYALSPRSLGNLIHSYLLKISVPRDIICLICQTERIAVIWMDLNLERSRSPECIDGPASSLTWADEDKVPDLTSRKAQSPISSSREGGIYSPPRNSTIDSTASSVVPLPWQLQYVLSLGMHHFN